MFLMAFLSIAVPIELALAWTPRTALCAVFSKAFGQLCSPLLKECYRPGMR